LQLSIRKALSQKVLHWDAWKWKWKRGFPWPNEKLSQRKKMHKNMEESREKVKQLKIFYSK